MRDSARLRRRDVLLYGLAWPVGVYGGWSLGSAEIAGDSSSQELGFGYIGPKGEVIAADRLQRGDATFLEHGAQVSVEGFAGTGDRHTGSAGALDFAVVYRIETQHGFEDVPYWVWQERTHPLATSSSPVQFVSPVSPDRGLRFRVVTGGQTREISLFPGGGPGACKLKRGRYVLGVSASSDFGWRGLEWVAAYESEAPRALCRSGWFGDRPVGFDALVLTVDYA